jgi:hypothetical protein
MRKSYSLDLGNGFAPASLRATLPVQLGGFLGCGTLISSGQRQ